jgi:hypothetical protein
MVVTAFVLVALGILLGLFFPVMFVAAAAGAVLLVIAFLTGLRRADEVVEGTEHRPE